MFEDVNAEVNRRLKEVKSFYSLIKDNAETEVLDMRVFKGTYFVILYGVLEYTITASVQKCLSIINQKKYDIIDLKPTLYSMVFNDECNAMIEARDKKWMKRHDLFFNIIISIYKWLIRVIHIISRILTIKISSSFPINIMIPYS